MTSSFRFALSPRAKRRLVVITSGFVLGTALFLSVGWMTVSVDPLQPADAVYVLGGSRISRALEAVRLYREGYAPQIVLSPGSLEPAAADLDRQGIHVPDDADIARDILVTRLGVPASAVIALAPSVNNTAQEALAIAPIAAARHWTRLIIITDRVSTRRAGFAFRRVFGGRLRIMAECTRDDDYDPARWWASRASVRATFYEAPKLVAYWLGLGG